MFEYGKTHALRVLDEAESFIKKNLCALSEDDLCGVETFVAEYLWMRETYSRLLAIWPGRKYRRNERTVLLRRFRELVPDLSFSAFHSSSFKALSPEPVTDEMNTIGRPGGRVRRISFVLMSAWSGMSHLVMATMRRLFSNSGLYPCNSLSKVR